MGNIPDEQLSPVYPGMQEQENELTASVQVPPLMQGLLAHSLISRKGVLYLVMHNSQRILCG